jgi:hypothetical protein
MKASVEEVYNFKIDIGAFSSVPVISGNLSVETFEMDGTVEPTPVQEIYNEDYEIDISLTDDIILPTKGKVMNDDIVVKKVPVTEVSNESGGYTLTIG